MREHRVIEPVRDTSAFGVRAARPRWSRTRRHPTEPGELAHVTGYVDVPKPGSRVERRSGVVVQGWHLWDGEVPAAVTITVDGIVVAAGLAGTEARPDVAQAHDRPELTHAGWSLVADLSRIRSKRADLVVAVWPNEPGPPVQLAPIPVRVVPARTAATEPPDDVPAPDGLIGRLDIPDDDEVLEHEVVSLVGWALTPAGPVGAVEVLVDGRSAGRARLGLPRADVAELHAAARMPHAALSGFEAVLDLTGLPHGTTSITVDVVAAAADGSMQRVDYRTFAIAAPDLRPQEAAASSVDVELRSRARSMLQAREAGGAGLRLAVFTHHLGYGGGQLWLSELLDVINAGRDFPCTVIAPVDGPLRLDLEKAGIDVHLTQDITVRDAVGYEGRITETALLLAELGANAVLVNTMGQFAGADAANRLGLPVVWAIHESFPLAQFWKAAYGAGGVHPAVADAAIGALRDCAALVFEAEATRQQYMSWSHPDRCLVVRYGINTAAITAYLTQVSRAEARAQLGVPQSCRLLLVVGTTEPRKAQTVLAEAFAALGPDRRELLLAFVGDTGTDYALALADYLAEADLADHTRLVPVTKDLYPWYRAADVLVSGSDVESLPRSALEAMCFGVPVLASAVFGLPELIDHGATGFLFEPQNLTAATDAMRMIAKLDDADLDRVGRAARRLILDRYDSAGYGTDLLTLLKGLCADPTRLPATLITPR